MGAALTTRIKVKDNEGRVVDEKEVATYAGLLAKAHEEGLRSVQTRLVQVPAEDNGWVAIVEATIETGKGTFGGIGDASPQNVGRRIVPHIIRMAETRAKARAFRDAVNIGVVAMEELGGEQDDSPAARGAPPAQARSAPRSGSAREPVDTRWPQSRPEEVAARRANVPERGNQAEAGGRSPRAANEPIQRMTENQRRWLYRHLMVDKRVPEKDVPAVLCRAAQVASIEQVSKGIASSLIDGWKEAANA